MKKPVVWYEMHVYYCPVCGREEIIRERKYGYKPENVYIHHVDYDWCDVL